LDIVLFADYFPWSSLERNPRILSQPLRRTCARLCHLAGGELDQIQFLLGHVSIQTTERYLGCKQKLRIAVNDQLGSSLMPLDRPTARAAVSPPWATRQDLRRTTAICGHLWVLLCGSA